MPCNNPCCNLDLEKLCDHRDHRGLNNGPFPTLFSSSLEELFRSRSDVGCWRSGEAMPPWNGDPKVGIVAGGEC